MIGCWKKCSTFCNKYKPQSVLFVYWGTLGSSHFHCVESWSHILIKQLMATKKKYKKMVLAMVLAMVLVFNCPLCSEKIGDEQHIHAANIKCLTFWMQLIKLAKLPRLMKYYSIFTFFERKWKISCLKRFLRKQ